MALAISRLITSSSYRGPQPRQAVLEQVVAGPLSHGGHGDVFTHGPRHDQERDVLPSLSQAIEGGQGVELGQLVVREDQVGGRVEAGEKVRLGFDPLPLRFQAGPAQLVEHQLGIGLAVFDDQNADALPHDGLSR